MRIIDRDMYILRQLSNWKFMLARHVKAVAFKGQRACDRRLKLLRENEYIHKQKYIYGIPSLYTLAHKGKLLLGVPIRQEKIRIEQIVHDIAVIDTAIYCSQKYKIDFNNIITEKQLHSSDGFGIRQHQPDFVFSSDSKTYCVEIEMSLKAKPRLQKIVENNFLKYDCQIWIVPNTEYRIRNILSESMNIYSNIEILSMEEVQDYAVKPSNSEP